MKFSSLSKVLVTTAVAATLMGCGDDNAKVGSATEQQKFERIMLLVAGFGLLLPDALSNYVGIGILVAYFIYSKIRKPATSLT